LIEGYDKSVDNLYEILSTNKDGLPSLEAEQRLEEFGLNELKTGEKVNPLVIFLNQFKSWLLKNWNLFCLNKRLRKKSTHFHKSEFNLLLNDIGITEGDFR